MNWKAESDLHRQYNALQREHPQTIRDIDGVTWQYTAAGSGSEGLMLFPGAVGSGDVFFPLVPVLADRYRLLMITIPAISDLEQLVRGLELILEAEMLDRVAMIGSSFGGMIAQAFLFRHRENTTKVVLSATAPPRPGRAAENERWHWVYRAIPMAVMRSLLRIVLRVMFKKVDVEPDFWRRYYSRALADFTREDLECRYQLALDFDRSYPDAPPDLTTWEGEMLVVQGSHDRMITDEFRRLMRATYPRARHYQIEDAGHGPYLERPREWTEVVTGFLLDRVED